MAQFFDEGNTQCPTCALIAATFAAVATPRYRDEVLVIIGAMSLNVGDGDADPVTAALAQGLTQVLVGVPAAEALADLPDELRDELIAALQ